MIKTVEKILPLRSKHKLPVSIVKNGDCTYCCIAGLLGVEIEKVYELCVQYGVTEKYEPLTHEFGIPNLLGELIDKNWLNAFIDHVPFWPQQYLNIQSYGFQGHMFWKPWFDYISMAIDAGYYGLLSVNCYGTGGVNDHTVLLKGYRTRWVDNPNFKGSLVLHSELCISDPNKEEDGWFLCETYLKNYGGYDVILVR